MKTFLYTAKILLLSLVISVVAKATVLAQYYNCGAYGAGNFGEGACGAEEVADTGLNVWLIRVVALALVVVAVYVVWRTAKKSKKTTK